MCEDGRSKKAWLELSLEKSTFPYDKYGHLPSGEIIHRAMYDY